MQDLHREGIVVAISGGLDASTVVGLCVRSVGRQIMTGLNLPEKHGNPSDVIDLVLYGLEQSMSVEQVGQSSALTRAGAGVADADRLLDLHAQPFHVAYELSQAIGVENCRRTAWSGRACYTLGMQQEALFDATPRYSVSDLTRRLRALFESQPDLQEIWVLGEISNLSRPASGHLYFTLKDASAQLRCVMWRSEVGRLRFAPNEGLAVEVHGSVSVYEAGGQYQLYADALRPLGEGTLYAEFLRLKAKLEAEGLFDSRRKRMLPSRPRRIGIITSPSGAALHDMLQTLERRYPLAEVILAGAPVQGAQAPRALIRALEALVRLDSPPEVILLGRGGGSIEDLWAFNDEQLVRAVAACPVPVVSGVGHETDFTLVDFAADLRAPTPTAAAELATPVTRADLVEGLGEVQAGLTRSLQQELAGKRSQLEEVHDRLQLVSPAHRLLVERQRLDELGHGCQVAAAHRLALASARREALGARLSALDPLAVLGRGYALVTKDQVVVRHLAQVQIGDGLQVRLQDGEFDARVTGA
jgi:exodeoxyribonuclease VII large subunit